MIQFPENFKWGVACASYQCEGAWDEDGKGPNIWDDFCHDPQGGHIDNGDTGDVACDSYHRYKEDVALMKQHNIKVYRFSVSWSRVIPDGDGAVNEKGLRFYSDLVDELLANGIEPMVTLYHWDLPSALQNKGGWLNRDIVAAFGRYAEIVAKCFGGRVKNYMTINEPQCVAVLGHLAGTHAPGYHLSLDKILLIYHHLCLAHSEAYRRIKAVCGQETLVGVAPCGRLCYPQNDTPQGREAAYKATFDMSGDWVFTFSVFLDPLFFRRYDDSACEVVRQFAATIPQSDWDAMVPPDYVGFNVYRGSMVDDNGNFVKYPVGGPLTGAKWEITPEVMHYAPLNLYRRYGRDILVTENGLSCNDKVFLDGVVHDPDRIDFLTRYLLELHKTVEEGVPLMGYLQWSFLDNFEWSSGYKERFGIIYVDYQTLERIPKDSARWYAKVIETNGGIL